MGVSANRSARINISANAAGVAPGVNDARRQLRTFQREQARAAKQSERDAKRRVKEQEKSNAKIVSGAGSIAGGIGTALGMDVVGDAKGAVSDAIDFQRELTRLQVTGEMSKTEIDQFRESVLKASEATGVGANDIMKGSAAYIGFTGDAKGARDSLQLLAATTRATGATTEDVAGILATFQTNLKLDPSQWSGAMDILVKQAHVGGVELKDLASNFASVAALYATSFTGGASVKGLAEVSAMAQVLQNMTHSAEVTTTYLKDMLRDVGKNAAAFREFKIEPYTVDPKTKKKVLKDGLDLIDQLSKSKAAKDPEILKQLFPEQRSRDTAQYLLANLDAVHKITEESQNSNQVAKDFAVVMESSSGRIDTAWNKIKVSIANALSPERVEAFAGAVETAADAAGDVFHFIGGATKEEGTSLAAGDFANAANSGGEHDDEQQQKIARAVIRSQPDSMEAAIGIQKYGSPEAYKAGALQFLKSSGADMTPWGDVVGGGNSDLSGTVNPMAGGIAAGSGQNIATLARAIGMEVAKAMASMPPPPAPNVKIGAEPIQKAAANSKSHRRGQF